MREPKLGMAVGKKGIGKTYQTKILIESYVYGNPSKGVLPRRVLILDVNDEFTDYKAISMKDLVRFSVMPNAEIRRVRPFNEQTGIRLTLKEIANQLWDILHYFRGGMLLIEDINKYVGDHLPTDIVGAICSNRHTDLDIIMHFQTSLKRSKIKYKTMLKTIPPVFIVMGVSGCGKSTIGKLLADELEVPFFDGDDFHPEANVNKMASGNPLNDQARATSSI